MSNILVTFHKSNSNEWLWTVQDERYNIIGRSVKSFADHKDAIDNLQQLTGRFLSYDNSYDDGYPKPNGQPIMHRPNNNWWDTEPENKSVGWEVHFE